MSYYEGDEKVGCFGWGCITLSVLMGIAVLFSPIIIYLWE